jgi:SAM-dependent methyltransferase
MPPCFTIVTPTNDSRFLRQSWESLKAQTFRDFEWVIALNGGARMPELEPDPRIQYAVMPHRFAGNIGAIKACAFRFGTGEYLLEFDHDDLLAPTALEECARAFSSGADFVYSDFVDFPDLPGAAPTYHSPAAQAAWERCGWSFRLAETPAPLLPMVHAPRLLYPLSFEPSAQALSQISYAPNHLRAWRRSFYEQLGGHDMGYPVCDDLDLLQRTFLAGRMHHVGKPLYWYRVRGDGGNAWLQNQRRIQETSAALHGRNLHALVVRECELRGLPCYDLGGALNSPGAPWRTVDVEAADVLADLTKPWPFETHSVGAFRAFDILEHLPDKRFSMSELHRCLAPGGWLLSRTPSADGPGAFRDPTHVSYWVEDSFRYYTTRALAQYIRNTDEHFLQSRLFTDRGTLPYVVADLVSVAPGLSLPGERFF